MDIMSISGVVLGHARGAERSAGHGTAWRQLDARPRPRFLTLDPTQRPSAPLRWGT